MYKSLKNNFCRKQRATAKCTGNLKIQTRKTLSQMFLGISYRGTTKKYPVLYFSIFTSGTSLISEVFNHKCKIYRILSSSTNPNNMGNNRDDN